MTTTLKNTVWMKVAAGLMLLGISSLAFPYQTLGEEMQKPRPVAPEPSKSRALTTEEMDTLSGRGSYGNPYAGGQAKFDIVYKGVNVRTASARPTSTSRAVTASRSTSHARTTRTRGPKARSASAGVSASTSAAQPADSSSPRALRPEAPRQRFISATAQKSIPTRLLTRSRPLSSPMQVESRRPSSATSMASSRPPRGTKTSTTPSTKKSTTVESHVGSCSRTRC